MSRRTGGGNAPAAMSRAEQIASGRLRMDRNPAHTRISDPSLVAGRRKEIENVMRRARAGSPGSWDRKLIEAEEKDPDRWRHTGYKQMYMDGGGTSGGSLSPSARRSRSRSPRVRRSPPPLVSTTTPYHRYSRERDRRDSGAVVSSTQRLHADTSQSVVSSSRDRERERERERERDRERERRGALSRPRPPSPPPRRFGRSPSASSLTSCSDDSCSVCSIKKHGKNRSRSRSFSVPRSSSRHVVPSSNSRTVSTSSVPQQKKLSKPLNSGNANAGPSTLSLRRMPSSSVTTSRINVATTKKPKPLVSTSVPSSSTRPSSSVTKELISESALDRKRSRAEKVLEWQKLHLNPHKPKKTDKPQPSTPPSPSLMHKEKSSTKLKTHIKKEDERPKKKSVDDKKHRTDNTGDISPEVIAAALAGVSSEDDSSTDDDSYQHHHGENRITLSERFGKMAQWSADRSNAMQNMKITRGSASGGLTVRIDEMDLLNKDPNGDRFDSSPPHRFAHSPAPEGHYPDELLAVAPGGLPSWDDVRVRYDYYKKRGYLRGLTLTDYIKWEEWWYRYQQWLKQERSYEQWIRNGSSTSSSSRRRRGTSSRDASN